ncbi:MAG: Branched-chain amino acid transport system 2 carrier protein [Candidatus Anoxychlamydiales bacterium]|nr:Branched-chain amino acid transport system 2 carrier protein [Candidatus Anoxychlamydiales bacterium]NGX35281.1 Branched-chain amino acid transport system 2 carrier protein [Candidatus Anoxychlamydiales bacterium]
MNAAKKSSSIVIGLALFSMFFGSGNLIYPLFVGMSSTSGWITSAMGFLMTAVLLPFLGVIAMVLFKGDYQSFFKILGKRAGFLFSLLLLTIWIPLGSGPRCIALAFASISSYLTIGPIWAFSLIYSALVFFVISRKVGFLDILGKIITPLLIGSILVIFFVGLKSGRPMQVSNPDFTFFESLKEGYNTMDLIASFFFSASIIHILYRKSKSMNSSIKMIIKSSVIGISLLAFVYVILIFISAKYAAVLEGVRKDQLLANLSQIILGSKLSFVSLIAIVMACFSTSVALAIAYSDFLQNQVFKNKKDINVSIILAIAISFVMSLFGLKGITYITAPVLKICYPILLALIGVNIVKIFIQDKKSLIKKEVENIEKVID